MDEIYNDPFSLVQQQIQNNNEWSAQQAQNQMDFQREMSNTAHQREVADLKAAGLNPVLSAHTQGASTPSGAMGTTDHSGTQALVDLMSQMISADTAKTIAGYGRSGYGYGSGAGSDARSLVKGNYSVGGALGYMLQDLFTGAFGFSPREAFYKLGKMFNDARNQVRTDQEQYAKETGFYLTNPDGTVIRDIDGRPVLSEAGINAQKDWFRNVLGFSAKNNDVNTALYTGGVGSFYNKTKDRYYSEPKSYSKNSNRSPSHGSAKGSGAGSGGIKIADIPGVHPGWTR